MLAVPFKKNTVSHFNEKIKIFVTLSQYFNAQFRGILTRSKIQHSSGTESKRWLAGPNIWATRLNSSTSQYGVQQQAVEYLVKFLIRFKNRRSHFLWFTSTSQSEGLFFRMDWFQSRSFLPGDPIFSSFKNNYDKPSFKQRCAEFGISSGTDFRFKGGDNHSLGSVFIDVTDVPQLATSL